MEGGNHPKKEHVEVLHMGGESVIAATTPIPITTPTTRETNLHRNRIPTETGSKVNLSKMARKTRKNQSNKKEPEGKPSRQNPRKSPKVKIAKKITKKQIGGRSELEPDCSDQTVPARAYVKQETRDGAKKPSWT
mmetsp:Transcript_31089/g.71658  ORF Transcript_31089/g.71658 Transcript_31089/m.71658 type:complete len:135 (-) Transcript_31089:16-420(-)